MLVTLWNASTLPISRPAASAILAAASAQPSGACGRILKLRPTGGGAWPRYSKSLARIFSQLELEGTVTVVGDIVGPLVPEKHWESNR